MTMRDVADECFGMKKAAEQPASEPPVRSSELVIPLTEPVSSVNAFMEACDASGVKIPFAPCEVLMWDLKIKINNAQKALKGEAVKHSRRATARIIKDVNMQINSTETRGGRSLQPDCSARALAEIIAAALFTGGDGKKACRLVFELDSKEIWGGWSEPAAANHIAKIIEAHTPQADPLPPDSDRGRH